MAPFYIGFKLSNITISERTQQILALQSQIEYLLTYLAQRKIYQIKHYNHNGYTILVPVDSKGQGIELPPHYFDTWNLPRFSTEWVIPGYGIKSHYVAYNLNNPNLLYGPDYIKTSLTETSLIQQFKNLYSRVDGQSVGKNLYRESITGEIVEAFQLHYLYYNAARGLIRPDIYVPDHFIAESIRHILHNRLPVWTFEGVFMSHRDDLPMIIGGAYFAFAQVVVLHPVLTNFAAQIKVRPDGAIEAPVYNRQSIFDYHKILNEIFNQDIYSQEIGSVLVPENWEEALRIRLSVEGRLLLTVDQKYWVISLQPLDQTLTKEQVNQKLDEQLASCQPGMNKMTLSEKVRILDQLDGDSRWCYPQETWRLLQSSTGQSDRFQILRDSFNLVETGVYSGAIGGLISVTTPEVFPTNGEIGISQDAEFITISLNRQHEQLDEILVMNLVVDSDLEERILEKFIVDGSDVDNDSEGSAVLDILRNLFQNNWESGKIFSNWARIYYQETMKISNFPIYLFDEGYQARDSYEVSSKVVDYLSSLQGLESYKKIDL